MPTLISGLNASQKKAVMHDEGPLLVLAGAGSGKTRVLTTRIARLLKDGLCKPKGILAVTFTNKAAREMRERLAKLVSARAAKEMTISTFHSFGARVLRENGDAVGLRSGFTILDDHERLSSLRTLVRAGTAANEQSKHLEIATRISLLKNASRGPEHLEDEDGIRTAKIYKAYDAVLRKRQCVDFDDLLLLPLRIFERHPEILRTYQNRYEYVCIDEYQDTNAVQMRLAKLLAAPQNNIMVVGDDDQSIYAWRGADSDNVLSFSRTYKGCTTILLDTNYRSTRQILDAAMAVVTNNRKRKDKCVRASAGEGDPIAHYRGEDEVDEAQWVARSIKHNLAHTSARASDYALLFRTNAMMRRFEEELRLERVPYRVVGAMSFFDRKEVKDILAYMRFLSNPDDELSMMRVVRVPDSGLTKPTIKALEQLAARRGTGLYSALQHYEAADNIEGTQVEKCAQLRDWCRAHVDPDSHHPARQVREALAARSYIEALTKAYKNDDNCAERLENVEELLHGLELFERKRRGKATLAEYIQDVTLKANDNDAQDDSRARGITLMTIHKAKGLEFPVVYIVGLDDAVFPSPRTIVEGNIEEERRLFYVAMTRARKRLVLTYPHRKVFRGKDIPVTPCRFIREIPEEYLDGALGQKAEEERREYLDDFFQNVQQQFVQMGAVPPEPPPSPPTPQAPTPRRRPLPGKALGG